MEIHSHASEAVASLTYFYDASPALQLQRHYQSHVVIYRAVVRPGGVDIVRQSDTAQNEERLASVDVTLLHGIVYMLRFRLEHDTIQDCYSASVRIWKQGKSEPTEWTASTSCVTLSEQLNVDDVMSQFEDYMESIKPSQD